MYCGLQTSRRLFGPPGPEARTVPETVGVPCSSRLPARARNASGSPVLQNNSHSPDSSTASPPILSSVVRLAVFPGCYDREMLVCFFFQFSPDQIPGDGKCLYPPLCQGDLGLIPPRFLLAPQRLRYLLQLSERRIDLPLRLHQFLSCKILSYSLRSRNSGSPMDYPTNLSHKSFRFCGLPFWILSQGRNSPGTKVFPPEKRLYAPRRGSHTLAKKIGSSDTVSLLLPAVAEILDRRWVIPPICPTKASAFAGARFGFCPGEEAPPGPRFFLRKNACTRQGAARIRSQRKLARQIPSLCYSLR